MYLVGTFVPRQASTKINSSIASFCVRASVIINTPSSIVLSMERFHNNANLTRHEGVETIIAQTRLSFPPPASDPQRHQPHATPAVLQAAMIAIATRPPWSQLPYGRHSSSSLGCDIATTKKRDAA